MAIAVGTDDRKCSCSVVDSRLCPAFIIAITPTKLQLRNETAGCGAIEVGIEANFKPVGCCRNSKASTIHETCWRHIQKTKGNAVCTCSIKYAEVKFSDPFVAHRKVDRLIIKNGAALVILRRAKQHFTISCSGYITCYCGTCHGPTRGIYR